MAQRFLDRIKNIYLPSREEFPSQQLCNKADFLCCQRVEIDTNPLGAGTVEQKGNADGALRQTFELTSV